jgi:hypothetical protein
MPSPLDLKPTLTPTLAPVPTPRRIRWVQPRPNRDAFRRAVEQIKTCALDEKGIEEQRQRHARLAPGATDIERGPEAVRVRFAIGFDRQALEEMVAVEEQCCPFFRFAFDEQDRELTVTVREAEMTQRLTPSPLN